MTRHPGFRDKKIVIGFLLLVLVVQVKFCRFFAIHGNCKFSDRRDLNQAKGARCFIQKITPRTAALKLHRGSKASGAFMRTTSSLGFEEQRKRLVLVQPVSQVPSPLMGKYYGFRQKRLEFWHSLHG